MVSVACPIRFSVSLAYFTCYTHLKQPPSLFRTLMNVVVRVYMVVQYGSGYNRIFHVPTSCGYFRPYMSV